MRRMSFNMTTQQVIDRTKTVTRRLGWKNLKPGERLLAVDRLRSKDAKELGVIEVVSVRREQLNAITADDVVREGFPRSFDDTHTRVSFVAFFSESMDCDPSVEVTRIEFRYV